MIGRLTLPQVLQAAISQRLAFVRVAMPGEIVSFDPVEQTAQVKALLPDQIFTESGDASTSSIGVLNKVPVQFPGAAGFAETWPVAAGDPCLLVFSDRALDVWHERGVEADPADERRHDLSDAVAILGVRSKPGKLTDFDTARAVWGNKGPRLASDGSVLHLGVAHNEVAAQAAIRGSLFVEQLGILLDLIDTAATNAGVAINTAGAALTSAAPLNATPIMGGMLASPLLVTAGGALVAAGGALQVVKGAITSFKARFSEYLSTKAKLS